MTELAPELFGDVRDQRRQHRDHWFRDLARRRVELGDSVVQLDQLGDRGVEVQFVHLGANEVDRAMQQLERVRVGRCVDDGALAGRLINDVAPQPLEEPVHADDVTGFPGT